MLYRGCLIIQRRARLRTHGLCGLCFCRSQTNMKQAGVDLEDYHKVWQISFWHGIRLCEGGRVCFRASTDVLASAVASPDPARWEGWCLGTTCVVGRSRQQEGVLTGLRNDRTLGRNGGMKRRGALAKKVKQVGRARSSKVWCIRHKGEASQGTKVVVAQKQNLVARIMRMRLKVELVIGCWPVPGDQGSVGCLIVIRQRIKTVSE